MKIIRYVATNDRGMLIGKYHPNCRHSDDLIDRIRDLHEEESMGYRKIANLLGISRHTVRDICRYTRRAQSYTKWKPVTCDECGALADGDVKQDCEI